MRFTAPGLVPERRDEHGRARSGDGAQPGDQLYPHHTPSVSRDLRGERGVRNRRFEGPAFLRARRCHTRVAALSEAAAATSGRIVVAEDHHPEGGLGSAVTKCLLSNGRTSLHIAHLAVRGMPGSGTGRELMAWAGIDADHIAAAARGLVGA